MARIIPGIRVALVFGDLQVICEAPGAYAPDIAADLQQRAIEAMRELVSMDAGALDEARFDGVEVTITDDPE